MSTVPIRPVLKGYIDAYGEQGERENNVWINHPSNSKQKCAGPTIEVFLPNSEEDICTALRERGEEGHEAFVLDEMHNLQDAVIRKSCGNTSTSY
jgi:hypothetical protein